MNSDSFKNVSTKWDYKSYIFKIYLKAGFGIKLPTMRDMPKDQTKQSYLLSDHLYINFSTAVESKTLDEINIYPFPIKWLDIA